MEINRTAALGKKQTTMKSISKAIVRILLIFIALDVLVLISSGVDYVQGFLSDRGTVNFVFTEVVYSSPSEKIQTIFLSILDLLATGLSLAGSVLLWQFFSQIVSKNKPFLPGQGKRLQTVSILLMMSTLLLACCSAWAIALSTPPMHVSVVIWTFLVTLVGGMLYPLIFFCMAVIFNHGMQLQTEYDETL